LWWFGYLEQKVSACRSFEVAVVRDRGRSTKMCDEFVNKDLAEFGLYGEWALG